MTESPYRILSTGGERETDILVRQGVEAHQSGLSATAQRLFELALAIDPRHDIAAQNIAVIYAESNLLTEALLAIERAHILNTKDERILCNWVYMALAAGWLEFARASALRATVLFVGVDTLMASAAVAHAEGDVKGAIGLYREVLGREPDHALAGRKACWLQTLIDVGPEELLRQRRQYRAALPAGKIRSYDNDRTENRPLRVGYVSGDFRNHSAAVIFAAVLLHHTESVAPHFYSTLPTEAEDPVTRRFRDCRGSTWRDIATDDADAAELIASDAIDILVDLSGHTKGGRLGLFIRKPAPIQVTAWGCAHGTGCPEIDYFFADPIAVPESERQHYAEKIWDLPCVVTFDPPEVGYPSQAPASDSGFLTFGCYARAEKLSAEYLGAVAEILTRTPGSQIRFKDAAFRAPHAIRRVMGLLPGIDPARLLFSGLTRRLEHLLDIQQCDLMLDPFPHSGGTAALEQLYMGVPVLTLYGRQPSGRTTTSVLEAMGYHAFVARSRDEYIERATSPIRDVRKNLRADLMASRVVAGYVGAVEKAYRGMWRRWCDGTRV